jgi:hypothetical protein
MATLPPEDALSGESVVHCFQSEKRGIPTTGSPIPTIRSRIPEPGSRIPMDGQIWPEQIGIRGRIKSESAIGLNRNQWSVWIGIRSGKNKKYIFLHFTLSSLLLLTKIKLLSSLRAGTI